MIDQRTTYRSYLKPHTDNTLDEDVERLRTAFDSIDSDVNARLTIASFTATYTAADVLTKLLTVDGPTSGISVQYLGGQEASTFASASVVTAHVGSAGAAHPLATSASSGFMSPAQWIKLDGIATGADVNTVLSVAGKTGDVTLSATDCSATPVAHVGSGGTAHAVATTVTAGFMAATDKIMLTNLGGTGKAGRSYFLRG